MNGASMDFVLTLHSHLPYVLNHGRWPHGSDWICEAAFDTYLPLLETLLSRPSGKRESSAVRLNFSRMAVSCSAEQCA